MVFDVQLGNNHFQLHHITLNIDDELGKISGELSFINQHPWERTIFAPRCDGSFRMVAFS